MTSLTITGLAETLNKKVIILISMEAIYLPLVVIIVMEIMQVFAILM